MIEFEPWQRKFWYEALEVDPDKVDTLGRPLRVYRSVLCGRPRKNAKSSECAAYGLYAGGPEGEPAPDVAVGSGSREQADVVFGTMRDMVRLGPQLRRMYEAYQLVIRMPSRLGVMRRVTSEGGLAMGLHLSSSILDELHVFHTQSQYELYNALVTSHGGREQPLDLTITTAGWNIETLLGDLYRRALEWPEVEIVGKLKCLIVARDRENGALMYWWGAPDGADPEDKAVLRACNPGSWVDLDAILKDLRSGRVAENDFRRLHMNQWVRAVQVWLPLGTWSQLEAKDLFEWHDPPLQPYDNGSTPPEGAEVYAGVDAALKYDTTACTLAWLDPETGRICQKTRVWAARKDCKHHVFVPGDLIDNELVESYLLDYVAKRYTLREVAYDPAIFGPSALRLRRSGLKIFEFSQKSAMMADALRDYYTDALTGQLAHDGDDVFRVHADSAAAVMTDRGWRLYKLKTPMPFDALTAAVMAVDRVRQKKRRRGPRMIFMDEIDAEPTGGE
jgi:phage terminase large subunit-like protein